MTGEDLSRLRSIADYQYGPRAGAALFPDDTTLEYSKGTGRIRHAYSGNELVASFRPTDGYLTLTIGGAKRLVEGVEGLNYTVTVLDDVAEVVAQGRNVMARHVVEAGEDIRPGDEVIVLDGYGKVVAVGKAILNRVEMLAFDVGVAVKVRRGRDRHR